MFEIDDPIKLIENLSLEFSSGNFKKVIELGEEGIQRFSEFPLLFLLLAKSYFLLKDFHNAKRILELGLDKFPFNRMLNQFWEEFNGLNHLEKKQFKSNEILFLFQSKVSKIFHKRKAQF